jgi:hypothetical protein
MVTASMSWRCQLHNVSSKIFKVDGHRMPYSWRRLGSYKMLQEYTRILLLSLRRDICTQFSTHKTHDQDNF